MEIEISTSRVIVGEVAGVGSDLIHVCWARIRIFLELENKQSLAEEDKRVWTPASLSGERILEDQSCFLEI